MFGLAYKMYESAQVKNLKFRLVLNQGLLDKAVEIEDNMG